MAAKLLVIDESEEVVEEIANSTGDLPIHVIIATSVDKAESFLEKHSFFGVLVDSGFQDPKLVNVLRYASSKSIPTFVTAKLPYPDHVNPLLGLPHYKIITKPITTEDTLRAVVSRLKTTARLNYHNGISISIGTAVKEILQHYDDQFHVGEYEQKKPDQVLSDYSSLISFSGEYMIGTFVVSFSKEDIINIVAKAIRCQPEEVEEEYIGDFVSEITNQVVGKVRTALGKMGHIVDMTIPEMLTVSNVRLEHPATNEIGVIRFGYPKELEPETKPQKTGFFKRKNVAPVDCGFNSYVEFCFDSIKITVD